MAAVGALNTIRPAAPHAGCVEALFVDAWGFDQRHEVAGARLRIGSFEVPAVAVRIAQPDIAERYATGPLRSPHAATSGLLFAGVVGPLSLGRHAFRLELDLVTGASVRATEGQVTVGPAFGAPPAPVAPGAEVVIAMATYNPPRDLFARQIESIRDQSHQSWACVVCDDGSSAEHLATMRDVLGDDERFVVVENRKQVGFYLNFERALAMVPESAAYVALCDQDDRWHPEKLARQVATLEADTALQLVATDVRVTDPGGSELSPTFYGHRAPTHDDPYSLFMVNSLIGASMVFRRRLLDVALPFPRAFENRFHDHWLARTALVTGDVALLAEPLHDYVQHGANVFGDRRAIQWPIAPVLKPALRCVAGGAPLPPQWKDNFIDFPLECSLSAQLLLRRHPAAAAMPWLARIVTLDAGQLRELSQILIDHSRERRRERPRRENVEIALFTGRSWVMDHRPQAASS